ncbi:TPA: hypothetical protein EYP70_05720 [Candidatus Bathyarchaeota archaeon]|nr:hypothetical protein [Candidatus Bathyarchaeota archaeon]
MGKSTYKVKGGKLVKVQLKEREGKIMEVIITGDFFLHPEEIIEDLERSLIGRSLEEESITEHIDKFLKDRGALLLGASPKDLAKCIILASEGGL